ncbi:phage tail protein [Pseudomonas sp. S2_H08]
MVDKNSIFGGMLTTQGAAKKTNCDALGIPWEPRYMLIGDANGTDPVPNPSQTKLVNQVYRAQLNQLRVSPTDSNVLIAELVLPPDVGGWWIRELALEDKDGVFCAVANAAPSYKPLLAQGSGRNQVVRMHIITSGTSNIQLKIDPSVVLATRGYVDDLINGLLPANKAAGTYTKVTVNDRGVFMSGSNPTTLAGFGIKDTYTKTEIESMIAQASALPVGATVAFPLDKVAPGFLELDGSVKSIAVYPDLAAFLGTAFNKGDEGAGNFRLPESRGEFLRGWDHGRGIDAGRAIGSAQLGTLTVYDSTFTGASVDIVRGTVEGVQADVYSAADYPGVGITFTSTNVNYSQNLAGGGVARPRNVAVMWCIKAWNAPIHQGNIDVAALAALATQATEVKLGTAKIATQAQADAGTDDATIVTPKKLRWGFQIQKATNGYIVFPSWLGGLIIQWGTVNGTVSDMSAPYPIQFPNGLFQVVVSMADKTGGQVGGITLYATAVGTASKTMLTVRSTGTDGQGASSARYIAIGH